MPELIELSNIDLPELCFFKRQKESQLMHYYEPELGVFIVESPKVIERALNSGYKPISMLCNRNDIHGETEDIIKKTDVKVFVAESDIITEFTGFKLIRGALCVMRRRQLSSPFDICKSAKRIAVLENVVNPSNIGAIFRSAAALGIEAILLTELCSDPLYRRSSRVSMGTVFQIPWTFINGFTTDVELLHNLGFKVASMALIDNSVDIDDDNLNSEERLAIILGAEGDGLSNKTIELSDYTIRIPMYNEVDSLNVAAASAVAFWQICKRNKNLK